jgi:nucleoside-diphosphate-sugar epimerase
MGDARVHLVTGFPGFIGKRLVRAFLAEARPGDRHVLLVGPRDVAAARTELDAIGPAGAELLEGDVQNMHLGLSGAEWKALAAEVTDVWPWASSSSRMTPTRSPDT